MTRNVEVVTSEAGLAALEQEWRDLWARTPTARVCDAYEWHRNAWELVPRSRSSRPLVAVVREAGRATLILPMISDRRAGLRRGRWLGSFVAFYEEALADQDERRSARLTAAWEAVVLKGRLDYAVFENVREDGLLSSLLGSLPNTYRTRRPIFTVRWEPERSWDEYWQGRSAKLRQDQRRQWRRLEDRGAVEFIGQVGLDEVDVVAKWIAEHKLRWMRQHGMRSRWFGDAIVPFFRAGLHDADRLGRLFVGRLLVGGEIVAMEVGFVALEGIMSAVTTYDERWRSYSPGRLLDESCLRWSAENGFTFYDFLTGTNPAEILHKAKWTKPDGWASAHVIGFTRGGSGYVRWFGSRPRAGARLAYDLWADIRRRGWPGRSRG